MKDFKLDGFVTKNVEVRGTNSGSMVTKFSVNSPSYNRETNTSTPQFFDCEYWWSGQQDFKARNIVEGALLLLSGQLSQDTWQDRQTGQNRSKVTLKVREIGVIRPGQQKAPQQAQYAPQAAPQAAPVYQQQQTPMQQAPQRQAPQGIQQQAPVVDASIYDTDIPF